MKPSTDLAPYETFNSLPTDICYVDSDTLDTHTTCIFKGSFHDTNGKKVGYVTVPNTFFSLHAERDCTLVFGLVGLRGFYKLPAWGVDIKRSYELMTSITEDGHAHITNKNNESSEGTTYR